MNRTYELMFIVRPDMVEEEQDKLISTLETAVTSSGGNVKSVEKMGKRRLAYVVRRFHDGDLRIAHRGRWRRTDPRTRTSPAGYRAGDQIHHRTHRRRTKASRQDQGDSRRQAQDPAPRPGHRNRRRNGRSHSVKPSLAIGRRLLAIRRQRTERTDAMNRRQEIRGLKANDQGPTTDFKEHHG